MTDQGYQRRRGGVHVQRAVQGILGILAGTIRAPRLLVASVSLLVCVTTSLEPYLYIYIHIYVVYRRKTEESESVMNYLYYRQHTGLYKTEGKFIFLS